MDYGSSEFERILAQHEAAQAAEYERIIAQRKAEAAARRRADPAAPRSPQRQAETEAQAACRRNSQIFAGRMGEVVVAASNIAERAVVAGIHRTARVKHYDRSLLGVRIPVAPRLLLSGWSLASNLQEPTSSWVTTGVRGGGEDCEVLGYDEWRAGEATGVVLGENGRLYEYQKDVFPKDKRTSTPGKLVLGRTDFEIHNVDVNTYSYHRDLEPRDPALALGAIVAAQPPHPDYYFLLLAKFVHQNRPPI
jgi:hypothetical protein